MSQDFELVPVAPDAGASRIAYQTTNPGVMVAVYRKTEEWTCLQRPRRFGKRVHRARRRAGLPTVVERGFADWSWVDVHPTATANEARLLLDV